MKTIRKMGILTMVASMLLVGCNDDDNDDNALDRAQNDNQAAVAALRIVHAVPDAPAVNILANGSTVLSELDYGQSSELVELDAGTYSVEVNGILPSGDTTVIGPAEIPLQEGIITNVFAVNSLSEIEPLIIEIPQTEVSPDETRVSVIHAAAEVPAVDVYVTTPGAPLDTLTGSFAFKQKLGPLSVPSGEYQVRITLQGESTVVYDSGTINFTAGKDLLVAAISNTGSEAAPVDLLVNDGSDSLLVNDVNAAADLKVIHAAPPVGTAEVFVNSIELGLNEVELIEAIDYLEIVPDVGALTAAPANDYEITVAADGTGPTVPLINVTGVSLSAGAAYSAIATGGSNGFTPQLLLLEENNRPVATAAKVKVIHAAPAAGIVDVFVTPAGTVSTVEVLNGRVEPTLAEFAFATITDYLSLNAGDYDIRVVADGSILAVDTTVTLTNGLVANVIAYGPDEIDADPASFGLLLTTNQTF